MTGTNWTSLKNHTGETGARWLPHPAYGGTWYLYAGKAHPGVPGILYASGVPASADYYVACDYTIFTDTTNAGICGRMSPTALTFYYCYYLAGELVLAKQVNGMITTLGVYIATMAAGGSTTRLLLNMVGSTIYVKIGSVIRISVTDTSITAAGRAGVRSITSADAGKGKHIDNWTCGDTSVAGPDVPDGVTVPRIAGVMGL
jgi:hypothetical protein